MFLSKEFVFDAAHNLVNSNTPCENLHGHTYRLRVTLKGSVNPISGMIMDFSEVKRIVKEEVVNQLDHKYLNEIVPLSTAENLVQWIWAKLENKLKSETCQLAELTLWETASSFITLRGNN